jgi:hypothetical protein
VQVLVDPNEPELPGHIASEQALYFVEAMTQRRPRALQNNQNRAEK